MYRFEHCQILRADRASLRKFFSDVAQLDGNTPSFFRVELTEGELGRELYEGQVFRYRFKLFGLPFPWETKIERVTSDSFVDSQARGPYRSFSHTHAFYEVPAGTLMIDRIDYELWFGPLNSLANALAIRPMLSSIFRYRAQRAAERFGEAILE